MAFLPGNLINADMGNPGEITMLQAVCNNGIHSCGNRPQEHWKSLATENHGNILAHVARKQAKALVNRCFPPAHGICSRRTLPQVGQSKRLGL